MKTAFILFFILVILGLNAEAGAPYGIKGQEQSTLYSNVHQFANKQVTNLGGINALVQDCGSSANLFENCGYEAGPTSTTTITGWTLTAGTMVAETTDVKQGKKSLKLTLSAQALDFYQTSTLNATAFADGVNGSLGLSVKTTIDNLYQCRTDSSGAVVASTDGTKITNCVKISNSGKWGDYVLPIILGATSNGLRLVSLTPSTAAAVAVTGDVYVDSGILEAGLKTSVVSNIGPWTNCTSSGSWLAGSPVYTCKFRQIGENYEYNMSVILGGATTATALNFNLPSGHVIDTSKMQTSGGLNPVVGSAHSLDAGVGHYTYGVNYDSTTSVAVTYQSSTTAGIALVSNTAPFTVGNLDLVDATFTLPIVGLSSSSNVYTVPSDSFSTDSNTLTWSASAITASSPIGTYNTYSYAINSNTKSLCTGTSDPDILPNASDGFKIFTRAYNAASTCGNPARVEIKIGAAGTKFPTIKTDIYKSAAKVISGSLDFVLHSTNAGSYGASTNSYDEASGVLILDPGFQPITSVTSANFIFSDQAGQTSGYLVINAQKAKDSIIGSFAEVVTSQGTTSPDIQSVYFGSGTNCVNNCITGSCNVCVRTGSKITGVTWDTTGQYKILGIDGTKYICTGSAIQQGVGYGTIAQRVASGTSTYAYMLSQVGGATVNVAEASVTCLGKP